MITILVVVEEVRSMMDRGEKPGTQAEPRSRHTSPVLQLLQLRVHQSSLTTSSSIAITDHHKRESGLPSKRHNNVQSDASALLRPLPRTRCGSLGAEPWQQLRRQAGGSEGYGFEGNSQT